MGAADAADVADVADAAVALGVCRSRTATCLYNIYVCVYYGYARVCTQSRDFLTGGSSVAPPPPSLFPALQLLRRPAEDPREARCRTVACFTAAA